MKKTTNFKSSWITLGIGLALMLMMGSASAQEEPEPAAALAGCAGGTIPRYSQCEIVLTSARTYSNPFTNVDVKATFTGGGQTLTAYGFYDGGNTWRIRFAPKTAAATVVNYTISNTVVGNTPDANLDGSGSFTVGPAVSKGFIEVDPAHKYYFRFSNGTPFYGIGDTAYGLVNGISDTTNSDPRKNLQRQNYLTDRKNKKFNFIRFFVPGVPKEINEFVSTAEGWPWGGQPGTLTRPGTPDYTRINLQFFRRLEKILGELKTRGMYAEMIVFNYYLANSPMPTTAWTTAHNDLWAKYVVSRLSAYDRVFLWTVTNEYEIYPKGRYEPVTAEDNTWAKDMAKKFHAFDPLKHPTTVHPIDGDMGPRFGSSADINVLTHQNWGQNSVIGTDLCSSGSADGIDAAIRSDRSFVSANPKPVINTEHQYEWLSNYGYPQTYAPNLACTAKARRAAWRIFVGGGATYANGFAGTWPGKDPYTHQLLVGARFTLRDEGMGQQVGYYANFINNTGYRYMNPAESLVTPATALCLAKPGSEYVVYAPNGGNVSLNLTGQTGTYTVTRLDPRTGITTTLASVSGGGWRTLSSPAGNDYVFRVKLQ